MRASSVAARNPESLRLSSRERIARLEGEIAGLWRYVKAQQPNGAAGTTDSVIDEVTDDGQVGNGEIDSESEVSDASPATAVRRLMVMTTPVCETLADGSGIYAFSQRIFSYSSTTVCSTHKTSQSRFHNTHASKSLPKRGCLERGVRSNA